MHFEVLGANIPRVEEPIKQALIDRGLIYVGEDNQLHVTEHKKAPLEPTKAISDAKHKIH